jgi:arsenite methyltransferase
MAMSTAEALRHHNADYGYDGSFHRASARAQAMFSAALSAVLLAAAGVSIARGKWLTAALSTVADALIVATVAFYLRTTRIGKFEVWAGILDELRLRGNETLLDLGCGRGAVLLAAAKLLPRGRAIGVDLWRADQTDNSPEHTLDNAVLENVADRVEVHTADITDLPFDDASVDVVVSNLAIHNIGSRPGRQQAITEAARVLRPGGRLAIADLGFTSQYLRQLHELGWHDVVRRNLGWRMWWGGPWFPTHVVTAIKPQN